MNAPAGFWRRYAAYSLDATAIAVLSLPLLWSRMAAALPTIESRFMALQMRVWALFDQSLASGQSALPQVSGWARDAALREAIDALSITIGGLLLAALVTLLVLSAVWFVAGESSRWQASPGKKLLGLRVTDLDGNRCGPGRIVLRFVAGAPSWLLLNLGHAMAGWTRDKRALHDYIAGTRVEIIEGASPTMPPAARSWLLLQAAAFFGLVGFVMLRYLQLLAEIARDGLY